MRRREIIILVGCATVWPVTARADQPTRRIGVLGLLEIARSFLEKGVQS